MTPEQESEERSQAEDIAAALLLAFLLKQALTIKKLILSGKPIKLDVTELKDLLEMSGQLGAQVIADNAITDPQIVKVLRDSGYIEDAAVRAAHQMNETTIKKAEHAFNQLSFDMDHTPLDTPIDEKANHVHKKLVDLAPFRAVNAAGNMVVDGAEGLKDLIVNSGTKTWHTMGDKRVRPTHRAAAGQTVRADQHFQVGSELLMFPRDPEGSSNETQGCRCVSSYSQRW